jgi:hypothetical protein
MRATRRLHGFWTVPVGRRLAVVIAFAIIAIAATSGVALAHWAANGSGTGTATTGTITINVTGLQGSDTNLTSLLPGQSGDVLIRVNNPNAFSVHVASIAANGIVTASPTCAPTGVSFNAPSDYSAAQFTLSPGSNLIRLSGGAIMDLSSASACQGAIFSIPLSVTVQK